MQFLSLGNGDSRKAQNSSSITDEQEFFATRNSHRLAKESAVPKACQNTVSLRDCTKS